MNEQQTVRVGAGLGRFLSWIAAGFSVTIGVGLSCCFLRWLSGVIHLQITAGP